MFWILPLLTSLTGCTSAPPRADRTPLGPGYTHVETGTWADDTADDTGGDTADTGPQLAALALYPDGLIVHPGATWALRLLGTWDSGETEELTADWAVEDPTVVSIDKAGIVTALGAGSSQIQADIHGQTAQVGITVQDDGLLTVHLIDAKTGGPASGVRVRVGEEGTPVFSDAHGQATLSVSTGEAIDITAFDGGFVPLTVMGTVGRAMTLALESTDDFALRTAGGTLQGTVDFTHVEEGGGFDLGIGMAVPTFTDGPLLAQIDELMGEDRTISVFGVEAEMPSNIFIRDHAESWSAHAEPGSTGMWAMAGPIAIEAVTGGMSGTGDAMSLLRDNLGTMSWTWSEGGTVSADAPLEVALTPELPFDQTHSVQVGELSLGFTGDEEAMVMVGEWRHDIGFVMTGFGLGTDQVTVQHATSTIPEGQGMWAMAMAQVDGLGSGEATCHSAAPITEGGTVLPPLQDVPWLISFDGATRSFELSTDPRARWVRVLVEGGTGSVRELLFDGGSQLGQVPDPGFTFSYGRTTWSLLALETGHDTFEGHLRAGRTRATDLATDAHTAARTQKRFTP
jgi:hypothetical protein